MLVCVTFIKCSVYLEKRSEKGKLAMESDNGEGRGGVEG